MRWFLFGAQAAILHGVARLSADIDVTVELGARSAAELVAALAEAGLDLIGEDATRLAETTRVLAFVHRTSRIPVDVVLAGPGLEEQFFARVEERVVGEARVPVAAAEDLVVMKVLAGRPRDLDDVAAILRARRGTLDLPRIRATLGLLDDALDRRDLLSELDRLVSLTSQSVPPPA